MQYQLSKSPFINVNINIVIIAYQYFLINALCTSGDKHRHHLEHLDWLLAPFGEGFCDEEFEELLEEVAL